MKYANIKIESNKKIAYITIVRESQLNALNKQTIKELHQAIKQADKDKNIRCIIISGEGEKAFVAGADIKEFGHPPKEPHLPAICDKIEKTCGVPTGPPSVQWRDVDEIARY